MVEIVETIGITEIGLLLLGSNLICFLKTGVTFAAFHSLGYISVRMDFVKMLVSEGAIIPVAILNSLLGISSRPVAFYHQFSLNRFNTISIPGV